MRCSRPGSRFPPGNAGDAVCSARVEARTPLVRVQRLPGTLHRRLCWQNGRLTASSMLPGATVQNAGGSLP